MGDMSCFGAFFVWVGGVGRSIFSGHEIKKRMRGFCGHVSILHYWKSIICNKLGASVAEQVVGKIEISGRDRQKSSLSG
jgi:hypothetical protein